MTIMQNYGPEIIGILESFEALLQKIRTNVEAVAPPKPVDEKQLLAALSAAIAQAAAAGKPYTVTGMLNGIHARKEELPDEFHGIARDKLRVMARKLIDGGHVKRYSARRLIDNGKIQKYSLKGAKAKRWLDVPGGALSGGRR